MSGTNHTINYAGATVKFIELCELCTKMIPSCLWDRNVSENRWNVDEHEYKLVNQGDMDCCDWADVPACARCKYPWLNTYIRAVIIFCQLTERVGLARFQGGKDATVNTHRNTTWRASWKGCDNVCEAQRMLCGVVQLRRESSRDRTQLAANTVSTQEVDNDFCTVTGKNR